MILLTGAAGRVAQMLRPQFAHAGLSVRLTDRVRLRPQFPTETFVGARLQWRWQTRPLCRGVDTVVHLGAKSLDGRWDDMFDANVRGLTNLLDAAREAGVKRFIFASSMHVFGMYPRSTPLLEDTPPSPDSRYAASKVFGEAAVRLYATKYALAATILRIGHAVQQPPLPVFGITADDLGALVLQEMGCDAPGLRILHAVSPHEGQSFSDDRLAREGFRFRHAGPTPAEVQAALARQRDLTPLGHALHGGDFADRG